MAQPKPTLEEMATACREEADRLFDAIKRAERTWPDLPPNAKLYHQMHAFKNAASLLRILATFEDRSRRFVEQLVEEHSRG